MAHNILRKTSEIAVPVETLFSWHAGDGAISRLTPPWAPIQMKTRSGPGIKKGVKVVFRLKLFGIPMTWEAEHVEYKENRLFRDHQVRGPFKKWEHTHIFRSKHGLQDSKNSLMEDVVEFELPFSFLSRPFYGLVKKELKRVFNYRHRILKYDLEHYFGKIRKKKILISGASGTIGSALVPFLRTLGHEVICLVRKNKPLSKDELFWDPSRGILDLESRSPFDVLINLNGVDISRGRWSDKQKKRIIDSRVVSTELLVKKMQSLTAKPGLFISSSAIGFYGEGGDTVLTEESCPGTSFISSVCRLWEKASEGALKVGIRTVQARTGIVLTPAGGALARMVMPFRAGLGVKLSHARQYMSWITIDDLLSAFLFIIDNDNITGPVNLTCPNAVTNRVFSETLAAVFSKKVCFTMPGAAALLLWGEMAKETLLASARVKPCKLLDSGFSFQHGDLFQALGDVLGR